MRLFILVPWRYRARWSVMWLLVGLAFAGSAPAAIRDGGIDPANLGKGEWLYYMNSATNRLGGYVSAVTNETSLMRYFKSQGVRFRNEMEVGPGGRQIQVEDPDGNPIELFEPSGR